MADDDFNIEPGRSRDSGARSYKKAKTLLGRVAQVSHKPGYTRFKASGSGGRGTGHYGRGKLAALTRSRSAFGRRVLIKARVVRQWQSQTRSAPLARHINYIQREGATRDGSQGRMFDATSDEADGDSFAERCEDDRHHFRFIVSPEDANEMGDLRAFTREFMTDMASDLDTSLDWVAVDHWNTDNPHIHVLVRGVATGGEDLVIDRAYISEGLRARAEERVTIELGPRSERDIHNALAREVDAERWTSLDRRLHKQRGAFGEIDLRPEAGSGAPRDRSILIGRVKVLERMGLAEQVGPASWTLASDIEPTLRALGERGDIIKTMHRAMTGKGLNTDPARLALHEDANGERVIGRLVERGLHDELTGKAYAIVDGADGRIHHLRFPYLERTGDAAPGAIVETSAWTDRKGRQQMSLLVRSDFTLERQIGAGGATWLDRQLVSPRLKTVAGGFGSELRDALGKRADVLLEQGLAKRQGQKIVYARNLLGTLRERDLAAASDALAARHGGTMQSATIGDHVAGVYRERVTLASGRFAMIDNGVGFQLVPWRQDLERHLRQTVAGRVNERGSVDWSFTRSRGPSV